jgi:hypothetical protein
MYGYNDARTRKATAVAAIVVVYARALKGDKFATREEMKSILSDPLGAMGLQEAAACFKTARILLASENVVRPERARKHAAALGAVGRTSKRRT